MLRWILGSLLLVLALMQLGFRGMQRVRSDVPLWDFVSVHSATRTWMQGGNPYDLPSIIATWHQSGLFLDRDVSYFATVYPPTSLLLMTPLAAVNARLAMEIWLALTLVLLALQYAALVDVAGFSWRDARALLLVGASLAAAPLQFGILSGQLSLPAISLCVIAFWLAGRGREYLAGVVLGFACALKPQIGAPLIAFYLLRARWRVFGVSAGLGALLVATSLIAMHVSRVDWIGGWTSSIAATTVVGGVNDYGWANRFRDEIVDLKLVLVSFTGGAKPLTGLLVMGLVGAATVWFVASVFVARPARRTGGEDDLLVLGALCAIALLPIYHRVYDVTLLTVALAWALAELDGVRKRYAIGSMIPMLVFLVPFDIVKSLGARVHAVQSISRTWWWQTFFAPHYAIGLCALTIALLIALRRATRSDESTIRGAYLASQTAASASSETAA